jgi:hypothetical protein
MISGRYKSTHFHPSISFNLRYSVCLYIRDSFPSTLFGQLWTSAAKMNTHAGVEDEQFEYIGAKKKFFPLLELPSDLLAVICFHMPQRDLSRFVSPIHSCLHNLLRWFTTDLDRFSRTCRAFRHFLTTCLTQYLYRNGPNGTTTPFRTPRFLPKNLTHFTATFPSHCHASSFIVSEFKIFLVLLSQCHRLKSISIEFSRIVQNPFCLEFLQFDWAGAVKLLTQKSAASLQELRLIFYPTITNFGILKEGMNAIEYISSTLTSLRILDLDILDEKHPTALKEHLAPNFSKLTGLETLVFLTLPYGNDDSLATMRQMRNMIRLQYLSLSKHYYAAEFSRDFLGQLQRADVPPVNLVWRVANRDSTFRNLLQKGTDDLISDWLDEFDRANRPVGALAWDLIFHQNASEKSRHVTWAHPWSGPGIRHTIQREAPPEDAWLQAPESEKLFVQILDSIMQAAVRSRNPADKSFFLPHNCITTLQKLAENCIYFGRSGHLKQIFLRVPFLHVQRPSLIPLIIKRGQVPIIERICNTRNVPARALESVLCTSVPECDGPQICQDAYVNKVWKAPVRI